MIEPYKIERVDQLTFKYIRDDGIEYEVIFEESSPEFTDACINCHRMWQINWFGQNDGACLDVRSGRTLVEILKLFLNEDYNDAVIYKLYNDDRILKRDILFDRLIKQYGDEELEKVCNENFVKNIEDRLCIIIEKKNVNYNEIVNDLTERCLKCEELQAEYERQESMKDETNTCNPDESECDIDGNPC